MFSLADLHCDTAAKLFALDVDLRSEDLHVNLDKLRAHSSALQAFAVCTEDTERGGARYTRAMRILSRFFQNLSAYAGAIRLCRSASELSSAMASGRAAALLAVEGGGAFDGVEKKIAQRLNTRAMGYGRLNANRIDRGNLMQYITPQDLKSFGLIPELVGRLPVLTYMQPLSREALRSILTEPKNAIVKQYKRLFELDGVKLSFDEAVLDYIVDKAVEFKLGARGLRSICEAIMMDTMFDIPSTDVRKFTVTLPYAKKKIEKANILELKQVG